MTTSESVRSVYSYVGDQMLALLTHFGLQAERPRIMQTYEAICQDSLAFPLGTRPPDYSRISHDGTPIQFSVTAGTAGHSLQFLGEAGKAGLSGVERMQANRDCMAAVADLLQARESLAQVGPLLNILAPETDLDLRTDPAGAFWIGAAFTTARDPQMRIYTNALWGKEKDRWARLSHFAEYFGQTEQWQAIEQRLAPDLKPLGTAITLGGRNPPTGRIYLTAYGKRASYYEALAESIAGERARDLIEQFAKCMLADDYPYPTQTAVCSFGFGSGTALDFKFELCGHCLFESDVQAETRLRSWFAASGTAADDYFTSVEVLSEGHRSQKSAELHCYVGVGLKQGTPYSTVYLKPRLIAT